jgi:hypothetical protein
MPALSASLGAASRWNFPANRNRGLPVFAMQIPLIAANKKLNS